MNERILELVEQAGFIVEDGVIDWASDYSAELETFAILLIKECGSVADDAVEIGIPSTDIENHFGV
jgi:hypothetical protein